MTFDMNVWEIELRRGTVELCILSALKDTEGYGYEIIERLNSRSKFTFTESTVYPVLSRLAKDGLLSTRQVPSPHGPPRRYFRMTTQGREQLAKMMSYWQILKTNVSQLTEP